MRTQREETNSRSAVDAALSMKERIRADLRFAMRARSSLVVTALRALLTRIDNSQVVPVGDAHVRYRARPFGDGSAEAPRVPLTDEDIRVIVENELRLRYTAAAELESCGKSQAASEAREEAAVIARYINRA